MPCIWATLEAGNNIIILSEIINNLSFAFVAPLEAKYYIYHGYFKKISRKNTGFVPKARRSKEKRRSKE